MATQQTQPTDKAKPKPDKPTKQVKEPVKVISRQVFTDFAGI